MYYIIDFTDTVYLKWHVCDKYICTYAMVNAPEKVYSSSALRYIDEHKESQSQKQSKSCDK